MRTLCAVLDAWVRRPRTWDAGEGFLGTYNGVQVVVAGFKEGPLAGKIATAYVPSPEQLESIYGR